MHDGQRKTSVAGSATATSNTATPAAAAAARLVNGLPEHCRSRDRDSGRLVTLVRGAAGSAPAVGTESPEAYNSRLGLTYEQVEAMEYGSTLGFHNELANPDNVRQIRLDMGLPVGRIAAPPVGSAPQTAASSLSVAKPASATKPLDALKSDEPEFQLLPEFRLG